MVYQIYTTPIGWTVGQNMLYSLSIPKNHNLRTYEAGCHVGKMQRQIDFSAQQSCLSVRFCFRLILKQGRRRLEQNVIQNLFQCLKDTLLHTNSQFKEGKLMLV